MSKVDGLELNLLNISSKQQKPNIGWQLYLGKEALRDLGLAKAVEGENTKHILSLQVDSRNMSLQMLGEDIITPADTILDFSDYCMDVCVCMCDTILTLGYTVLGYTLLCCCF